MKNKKSVIILFFFLAAVSLPVIFGWILAGKGSVFGGFIANPIDGQSYLAKMEEGVNGDWLFRLPFTSNPNSGQPIFLLYIFLGHLSKLLGIQPIFVFHTARILSALLLALSLGKYVEKSMPASAFTRTFALLLFGSGMGWVLLLFGHVLPIDFYVAEMYPFLSAYTNPHFPLGLGILLWILIKSMDVKSKKDLWIIFSLGILLSIILQFGIVLVFAILGGEFIWSLIRKEPVSLNPILSVLSGGGVLLLYQYFIIRTDPVLVLWDQQNVTPAPDPINLLMGVMPLLLLLIIGSKGLWKGGLNPHIRMLIIWFIVGILITYVPFNLQRRFLTGLYIPLAILSTAAINNLKTKPFWKRGLYYFVFLLSIITNLSLLMVGFSALNQKDDALYLKQSEYNVLLWVRDHSVEGNVVLANPTLSLYIPGIAGRNVVYGHPFETIKAENQKQQVEVFFKGDMTVQNEKIFLTDNRIRFIIFGPKEVVASQNYIEPDWHQVYAENEIKVYEINP